MDKEMNSLW